MAYTSPVGHDPSGQVECDKYITTMYIFYITENQTHLHPCSVRFYFIYCIINKVFKNLLLKTIKKKITIPTSLDVYSGLE